MTRAASLTGRATRGFAAYDEHRERLVFFKDFWRPNSPKIRCELDTYMLLNRQGVQNIATAIAGGDVLADGSFQRTVTQTYIQSATGPRPLERIHGRLVLAELACPLEDYFGSYELISVVNDAIQGTCGISCDEKGWLILFGSAQRSLGGWCFAPGYQCGQYHDI